MTSNNCKPKDDNTYNINVIGVTPFAYVPSSTTEHIEDE